MRINLITFKHFFRSGSIGGITLLVCVIISLLIANSNIQKDFERLLSLNFGFSNSFIQLQHPVLLWINDGLMAIFFLLVGLEIKRELMEGELSSLKRAIFPVFAAIGGVIMPAILYLLLNYNEETVSGWGIPMATDIAFALGVLSLLGNRIPSSLKIFLAALAIVDDLIAIMVIAIFYSSGLHLNYLAYSGIVFSLMLVFNKLNIKNIFFYLVPGLFLWYFIHHSGIHATIAGVLTALSIPTTKDAVESPLEKLEHSLTKPVNFIIMPLFAIANTNIAIEASMIKGVNTSLGLGIMLGLFIGKPIGITLFSWLAVKLGWAKFPRHSHLKHILGIGLLGGIGFTMSIFIALLSFKDTSIQNEAKFAVLIASFISGTVGFLYLRYIGKHSKQFDKRLSL